MRCYRQWLLMRFYRRWLLNEAHHQVPRTAKHRRIAARHPGRGLEESPSDLLLTFLGVHYISLPVWNDHHKKPRHKSLTNDSVPHTEAGPLSHRWNSEQTPRAPSGSNVTSSSLMTWCRIHKQDSCPAYHRSLTKHLVPHTQAAHQGSDERQVSHRLWNSEQTPRAPSGSNVTGPSLMTWCRIHKQDSCPAYHRSLTNHLVPHTQAAHHQGSSLTACGTRSRLPVPPPGRTPSPPRPAHTKPHQIYALSSPCIGS
jgi:hypothetical protein